MGTFSNHKTFLNPSQPHITNNSQIAATSINSTGNSRANIVESLVNSSINRITDNPFYFFNNLSMTKVTFYNINKKYTTLDEVIDNAYNFIGPASGFRFDKINDVVLYGIQQMELSIDMGEWGAEADPIEGEAYLPPNTFVPYQHAYFSIDYINKPGREVLFRITSVNIDTFPNGANFYKLSYKLESIGENILPQVVGEYQYLADNIGSSQAGVGMDESDPNNQVGNVSGAGTGVGMNSVLIDQNTYNIMNSYGGIIDMLKRAYIELFFQQSTQTFVFKYGFWDYFFYDPYMIEFLIRHRIFSAHIDPCLHVSQPALPPKYLSIDYNRTIFKLIEDPDSAYSAFRYYDAYALLVQDPMSLMTHRIEPYYMITFREEDGDLLSSPLLEKIRLFDTDLLNLLPSRFKSTPDGSPNTEAIDCPCGCDCNNTLSKLPEYKQYYKIIHNYLAGLPVTSDMIQSINLINFTPCKELYYAIPILIYILQATANSLGRSGVPNNMGNSSSNPPSAGLNNTQSNGNNTANPILNLPNGTLNENSIPITSERACPKGCLKCSDNR